MYYLKLLNVALSVSEIFASLWRYLNIFARLNLYTIAKKLVPKKIKLQQSVIPFFGKLVELTTVINYLKTQH